MGAWYTIGLCLGLGLGIGIVLAGILGVNGVGVGVAALLGIAAGAAVGVLVGDLAEAMAGGAAGLLGGGFWSAFHLPIDAVPDITGVQVHTFLFSGWIEVSSPSFQGRERKRNRWPHGQDRDVYKRLDVKFPRPG